MAHAIDKPTRGEPPAGPAWDVARLFPDQGHWSEEEYLALSGNKLVELSDGCVEVLPMPTTSHQLVVAFLYGRLLAHVAARAAGIVLFSPLRVRLGAGKFREPDVVFMRVENEGRCGELYWDGADLVMEVVSDDDRRRDLETKRGEYARAGIPEYWIVDPRDGRITVLRLDGTAYAEYGVFPRGGTATSALLPGFEVEVDAAFARRPGSQRLDG